MSTRRIELERLITYIRDRKLRGKELNELVDCLDGIIQGYLNNESNDIKEYICDLLDFLEKWD